VGVLLGIEEDPWVGIEEGSCVGTAYCFFGSAFFLVDSDDGTESPDFGDAGLAPATTKAARVATKKCINAMIQIAAVVVVVLVES